VQEARAEEGVDEGGLAALGLPDDHEVEQVFNKFAAQFGAGTAGDRLDYGDLVDDPDRRITKFRILLVNC